MSTKQRGDVEKIPAEKVPVVERPPMFKIYQGYDEGAYYHFTRDEFRRIWEAGNVSDQYVELSHLLAFLEAQP